MLWSLGKKKNNKTNRSYIPGTFSDQIIFVTDETVVQCDVPGLKNNFVGDGNTNDVKRFDLNSEPTVPGTNFVYSFNFLKNWSL